RKISCTAVANVHAKNFGGQASVARRRSRSERTELLENPAHGIGYHDVSAGRPAGKLDQVFAFIQGEGSEGSPLAAIDRLIRVHNGRPALTMNNMRSGSRAIGRGGPPRLDGVGAVREMVDGPVGGIADRLRVAVGVIRPVFVRRPRRDRPV